MICVEQASSLHHKEVAHARRFDTRCRKRSNHVRRLCCRPGVGRFSNPSEAIGATIQCQAPVVLIRDISPARTPLAQESTAVNDNVRRYARLQVPRYTSYPTAAEFTPAVAAVDQRRWLRDLDTTEAVSVYLYVPYCRELCLYCSRAAAWRRRGVAGLMRPRSSAPAPSKA
jgi:hypothetical protein